MIKDAETFKQADKDFTAKHEAKQELESYISQVESTSAPFPCLCVTCATAADARSARPPVTSPEVGAKIKRQNKANVESELAKALERLEIEESTADELKKSHLTLRRAMQKVSLRVSRTCAPSPRAV